MAARISNGQGLRRQREARARRELLGPARVLSRARGQEQNGQAAGLGPAGRAAAVSAANAERNVPRSIPRDYAVDVAILAKVGAI